ncbi:hypothetical protein [Kineococcus rubinsiae]|uniref:hypothetical protein n=1 Tax=Kineococcus rubinsiae TaxID=2609562 RepID=UPI0014313E49|nr:hypothetical protein [Kineococcus rubinsiae]NIZ93234.1 hypothetical protein [Kineococcus rubinsiae]
MALVSVLSAKGSPGATTTAMLTAALWPRPVLLLDADPAGGDVGVRWPAASGGPLDGDRGLLPLLTQARRGLSPQQLLEQAQPAAGGTPVVCGLASPEQAAAAAALWPAVAVAADELTGPGGEGVDVVVDAGRVTARSVHLPLLRASAVVVLVLRADVSGVLHARERLRSLADVLRRADGLRPRVGVVVVDGPRAADAGQAAAAVLDAGDWAEDLGRLPLDPAGARVFSASPVSRPERTALVRAGRPLVATLAAAASGELRRVA